MSDEAKYQIGKEIHTKITANSQFKAQLDSSEISGEDMIETAKQLLQESNKECGSCHTDYHKLQESNTQLYVVWDKPLTEFDRIEDALQTENMSLLCGDCIDSKEQEDIVGNVSKGTNITEDLTNSLSSLEKLFKEYTPTVFITQNYLKLIFIYLFGILSFFTYQVVQLNQSLQSALFTSLTAPASALYQLIISYPPIYLLVLLPLIAGIYTLFEYYYPLHKFTTDYINPRTKYAYMYIAGGLLVGSVVHGYLFFTEQQPTIVLVLSISIILGSLYLSKTLISLVDSDKLDLMQRDLNARATEYAKQTGNTKQDFDGSTKPVINTKIFDEVISESKKQNNLLYGLTELNATAVKSIAVYNILLHISIIFILLLGSTAQLGFGWVLILYYFPPVTLAGYLVYRKILLEVFSDI